MTSNGWRTIPLSELVEDTIGGLWGHASDSSEPGETDALVIRGADFRDWDRRRALDAAQRRIPLRALERRRLRPGDLVLEVSGGGPTQPVGRILIVDERAVSEVSKPLICSNFCRKLRLKPTADPFFVKRQLEWLYTSGHMDHFQTSSTNIRNLQVEDLLDGTPILLPDPAAQTALAVLLDLMEEKRATTTSHLTASRRAVERFRQSVLAAAWSGQLTAAWREASRNGVGAASDLIRILKSDAAAARRGGLGLLPLREVEALPDSWQVAAGFEVFPFVTSGSRGWARYYSDVGPSFVRVGNLDRYRLDLDLADVQHVQPPSNAETKRTRVLPGDLLISITAEIGMVGIAPSTLGEAYVNQHVAIARPHPAVNARFLTICVAAPNGGQKQLDVLQRGATKAGLGLDDIRLLVVPLPSAAEQAEIVQRVDQLFALARSLEERIERAELQIGRSSQAVLTKAFRGELSINGFKGSNA